MSNKLYTPPKAQLAVPDHIAQARAQIQRTMRPALHLAAPFDVVGEPQGPHRWGSVRFRTTKKLKAAVAAQDPETAEMLDEIDPDQGLLERGAWVRAHPRLLDGRRYHRTLHTALKGAERPLCGGPPPDGYPELHQTGPDEYKQLMADDQAGWPWDRLIWCNPCLTMAQWLTGVLG